jgi:phage terminase Nu1 subunit (DNA packaging protein)
MMNSDWGFDNEKLEALDPETRRRIYKQMVKFKLDVLEEKIKQITADIERLDEGISKIRQRILMREIDNFLEAGNEEEK